MIDDPLIDTFIFLIVPVDRDKFLLEVFRECYFFTFTQRVCPSSENFEQKGACAQRGFAVFATPVLRPLPRRWVGKACRARRCLLSSRSLRPRQV